MTRLFGHEEAIGAFRAALESGRLHHAWLIAGTEGIGKASFARAAATRFLAAGTGPVEAPGLDVAASHPVANLVAAGSHPDLALLERETREGGTETARNITIAQVRGLQRLFAVTPSLSPRRAIVIDAADDLERGAANALLKHLEEPPAETVFLLVSHAPERLLPTIRSRCRLLRLKPLSDDAMTSALCAAVADADQREIASLVAAGEGAPGRAIAWRGLDIDALDAAMDELVQQGDIHNGRRSALAQSLSVKAAQPRYEAFLARVPARIARAARSRSGAELAEAIALWERAFGLAGTARRLSLDPQSTVFELAGMLAALAPASGRPAA